MKRESYKGIPEGELRARLVQAREELWKLRQQVAGQQLKNYRQIQAKRKQIARIMTEINAKKGAAE